MINGHRLTDRRNDFNMSADTTYLPVIQAAEADGARGGNSRGAVKGDESRQGLTRDARLQAGRQQCLDIVHLCLAAFQPDLAGSKLILPCRHLARQVSMGISHDRYAMQGARTATLKELVLSRVGSKKKLRYLQ